VFLKHSSFLDAEVPSDGDEDVKNPQQSMMCMSPEVRRIWGTSVTMAAQLLQILISFSAGKLWLRVLGAWHEGHLQWQQH
jgi:hypothetical protein